MPGLTAGMPISVAFREGIDAARRGLAADGCGGAPEPVRWAKAAAGGTGGIEECPGRADAGRVDPDLEGSSELLAARADPDDDVVLAVGEGTRADGDEVIAGDGDPCAPATPDEDDPPRADDALSDPSDFALDADA